MLNNQCSPPSQQRSSAPVLHYIFPLVTSPAIVRYIQVGVIVDHLSVMSMLSDKFQDTLSKGSLTSCAIS